MNAKQERVVESFRRIGGWFTANPQYVASNPALGTQVESFNAVVSRLTDHVTAQETQHAKSLLISKDEIELRRDVVVHQMKPIAKVARALRGTVPGIGVLSMPKGHVRTPEILAAATAMAEKAGVYKEVLLESGLPTDFIEQLKKAGAALKSSVDSRGLARASRVAATAGVESELAIGRRIVAILDAVVTGLIRSEPTKVAEWEQLKRVTVKGVHIRAAQGLVDTSSAQSQPSSIRSQTSSIQSQTSSIHGQASATDVSVVSTPSVKAA